MCMTFKNDLVKLNFFYPFIGKFIEYYQKYVHIFLLIMQDYQICCHLRMIFEIKLMRLQV